MKQVDITTLQTALQSLGFFPLSRKPDGHYDEVTRLGFMNACIHSNTEGNFSLPIYESQLPSIIVEALAPAPAPAPDTTTPTEPVVEPTPPVEPPVEPTPPVEPVVEPTEPPVEPTPPVEPVVEPTEPPVEPTSTEPVV